MCKYDIFIEDRRDILAKVLRNLDKQLLIVSILLFIFGLIMIFSASNVTAYMSYQTTPYNFFLKQLLFLLSGVIGTLVILRFNTRVYGVFSWIFLIVIIATLILLLVIGTVQNQAVSWFDFGLFSFQPSELAKIITIVWIARYYEVNKNKLNKYIVLLVPPAVCFFIALLIATQPDLGTTIIFIIIVFFMFFAVNISKKIKMQILGIVGGLIAIFTIVLFSNASNFINSRQLERFAYDDPCADLLVTGSQVCNGYIAINNGGLTGLGLGNSTQKYLYLPEPYTDFIYPVIVEELGFVFACILMFLYTWLLVRILKIARRSYSDSGALMCYGVFVYIVIHILVNMMGVLGMIPMTGVPLPFMSYGGSFTLSLIIALAIVQRVNVETKFKEIEKEMKKR